MYICTKRCTGVPTRGGPYSRGGKSFSCVLETAPDFVVPYFSALLDISCACSIAFIAFV